LLKKFWLEAFSIADVSSLFSHSELRITVDIWISAIVCQSASCQCNRIVGA